MAKELFYDQILKKIVLARASLFEFSGERAQVLQRLLQNIGNYYRIAIRRRGEPWFFSKSPEKLFHWSEGHLQTVAIAGTAQRKTLKEENLTESSKDQYEHQLVVESILEELRPFATLTKDSPQDILQLSHIVHLRTRIDAEGVNKADLGKIVETLHPTPAVSGYPTKEASVWLQKIEPPRGMYAGLVGYITHNEVELAVTIRCGFLSQQEMQVMTGVGVVEESDVESEWSELDGKLMQILEGAVV
jgi:menaquinone-specific isochorismate synthase